MQKCFSNESQQPTLHQLQPLKVLTPLIYTLHLWWMYHFWSNESDYLDAQHYSCLRPTRKINPITLCKQGNTHTHTHASVQRSVLCSVREVATLDGLSHHQHAELKICCLRQWRAKHINAFEATVTLWETNISERSSIWPPLLHVQSSQWLNWKINSNLNDWNKELLESEIKRLSSPRSPLIGKSFLQGILMVEGRLQSKVDELEEG